MVVGIEGVQKPCEEFFKRQQIEYSVADISEIPGGKHFKVRVKITHLIGERQMNIHYINNCIKTIESTLQ